MTHRYPTRFQAKLASKKVAEAKKEAKEAPECTLRQWTMKVAVECAGTEKENELRVIKTLLGEAETSCCRFHRINAAIKLFHYFEYHHYLLKNYPNFREIVRTKIVEFTNAAKHERDLLDRCNHHEEYKEQCRMTTATEILMESCAQVRTLIQNM
jgi:hypothetical protein